MRVEGADLRTQWSGLATANPLGKLQLVRNPLLHFQGCFVGKRHRQDSVRTGTMLDQIRHSERDHPSLTRPRSCEDQKGTGQGIDCIVLGWVQVCHARNVARVPQEGSRVQNHLIPLFRSTATFVATRRHQTHEDSSTAKKPQTFTQKTLKEPKNGILGGFEGGIPCLQSRHLASVEADSL